MRWEQYHGAAGIAEKIEYYLLELHPYTSQYYLTAADWIACIRPLTGESPSELQKRVRLEQQVDAGDFEPVSEESSQEGTDQENEMRMG